MKMLIMTYEEIINYINNYGYEPLFDLCLLLENNYINNIDNNKYKIWIWEKSKHIDAHGGCMKETFIPFKNVVKYCPMNINYIYRG